MKVTLIDWPRDLIGTFSKVWAMSKTNGDWENAVPDEEEFLRVMDAETPVLRCANFVWIIEDMPVFFREQLVRAKHEDFWIQSMRVADLRKMYSEGRYYKTPEIENSPQEMNMTGPSDSVAKEAYRNAMIHASSAYRKIIDDGYPEEVARRVLPLATLHRGAWFTNLQALMERFKKRSCWVAEDLWVDVLRQVRSELVHKVHPAFANICTPPCYGRCSSTYTGCKVDEIMQHRMSGEDPLSLCPLWAYRHLTVEDMEYHKDVDSIERAHKFAELWGRDPNTGTVLSKRSTLG